MAPLRLVAAAAPAPHTAGLHQVRCMLNPGGGTRAKCKSVCGTHFSVQNCLDGIPLWCIWSIRALLLRGLVEKLRSESGSPQDPPDAARWHPGDTRWGYDVLGCMNCMSLM